MNFATITLASVVLAVAHPKGKSYKYGPGVKYGPFGKYGPPLPPPIVGVAPGGAPPPAGPVAVAPVPVVLPGYKSKKKSKYGPPPPVILLGGPPVSVVPATPATPAPPVSVNQPIFSSAASIGASLIGLTILVTL